VSDDFLIFATTNPQDGQQSCESLRWGGCEGAAMTVTDHWRNVVRGGLAPLALAAVVLFACGAMAQTQAPPQLGVAPGDPQQQAVTVPDAAAKPPKPGLFGTIGRWLDDSIGGVAAGLGSARETVGNIGSQATDAAKGAAGMARDAAATVARIPAGVPVTGRAHCVRTAGGGPDCPHAANTLCWIKGYTSGTSLHIQSEQKCPVWGWISGEKTMGKCSTETYVTSAMCR
jgi:hypothetical protein